MRVEAKINQRVTDQCVACLVIREDVCGGCHVCDGYMHTSEWPRQPECCNGSHECAVCGMERKCYMMIRTEKLEPAPDMVPTSKADELTKAGGYHYVCGERCKMMLIDELTRLIDGKIDFGSDDP